MLLTPNELIELTGYRRSDKQTEWLRAKGLNPWTGGDGKPKIAWDVVAAAMARDSGLEIRAQKRKGPRPNLEAAK